MTLKEMAKKYLLQNSIKFNGKPNPGAIIGKIIGEKPEFKSKMQDVRTAIDEAVKEISKISVDDQLKMLQKLAPELLEKKEVEQKTLKELKNAVEGKFITRMAPSASGPLHVGHAIGVGLIHAYAKRYNGKFYVRIEDTNPENIYPPAYDLIPEDAQWLTNDGITEVFVQSDRMDIYYKHAEDMLRKGFAYVCRCSQEIFKSHAEKKEDCPCRNLKFEEQWIRWKKMFEEYTEGEAVMRVKTDMQHKNPALRDWPAFRMNDSEHPRHGRKYRVWPLMNFSVVIDDIEMGMTHIMRGKDHADNAKKQEYVYNYLEKPIPETYFWGRINFTGLEVSCSKTRMRIEAGEFEGWDDPRIPFLGALRKRGYQAEALIKLSIENGLSLTDKTMSADDYFKMLNAFNKDIIEHKSNRYFFVADPVEVKIENAPDQEVELELHPDFPKRGVRKFKTGTKFYLAKEDFDNLKNGKVYRLMDCLNFKKNEKLIFDSVEYSKGTKIIHWLPKEGLLKAEVVMPDNSTVKGLIEKSAADLKEGDVCQLERVGFARLENKEKLRFYFAHR